MSEQRVHPRAPVRTLVTVLSDTPDGGTAPSVFKAWTEDISASGMQLACNEELPQGKICVRILLPELEDKIVECEIVRRGQRRPTGLLANAGPRFVYGVRFERVRDRVEFERQYPASAAPQ